LFRDGISCGTQNAAFIALNLSPFVLLGALSSTSELGLFSVSQRLVAVMVLALTTISQFAMRDFARASGEREFAVLARALTASVRLTFAAAIPITIVLVAFAPLWISVFGRAFAGGAATLALLSCAICAQCLGMPFQSALLATNHERSARDVTLVCAALGIALNIYFIPRWGAEGAAIGTGVGLALQSLGHAFRVLSLLPVRLDIAGFRVVPAQIATAGV
jgi:O-antigen/teichoic acid export membrane protein